MLAFVSEEGKINIKGNNINKWKNITNNCSEYISIAHTDKIMIGLTREHLLYIYKFQSNTMNEVHSLSQQEMENPTKDITGISPHVVIQSDNKKAFCVDKFGTVEMLSFPGLVLEILPIIKIKQVTCGNEHVILLSESGMVFTFGNGSRGQLGHGNVEPQDKPKLVEALEGIEIKSVAAGGWHTLALSETLDLYVWGWNESGQLGISMESDKKCDNLKTDDHKIPSLLTLPHPLSIGDEEITFVNISCGSRHSAGVSSDGYLWSWGWNKYGQLGHGDTITRKTPTCVNTVDYTIYSVEKVKCGQWQTVIQLSNKIECI